MKTSEETHKRVQELEKQNKELLEALESLFNCIDSCVELTPNVMLAAQQAIKNATK